MRSRAWGVGAVFLFLARAGVTGAVLLALLAGLRSHGGRGLRVGSSAPPPVARAAPTPATHDALELDTGVRLHVPKPAWVDAQYLSLGIVERPSRLEGVALAGPVRRLDWYGLLALPCGTFLEVPAESAEPHATLLVRSQLGFWLPLPAETVEGEDGRARLRVALDGQPCPWVFTVAATTAPTEGYAATTSIAFLEQLSWLDTAALPGAIGSRDASRRPPTTLPLDLLASAEARDDPYRNHDARDFLDDALRSFLLTRSALSDRSHRAEAWRHYRKGIEMLMRARKVSGIADAMINLVEEGEHATPWPEGLPKSEDALVVLETLCSGFAPWGLQVVWQFGEASEGVRTEGFDLRVLKPLGHQLMGDAALLPRGAELAIDGPWKAALGKVVRDERLSAEEARYALVLRFHSPRALEAGTIEKALGWTKDWVLRLGPALVGFWTGGLSGAVVPLAWALADYEISWLEREFKMSPLQYLGIETGKNATTVAIDALAHPKDVVARLRGLTYEINVNKLGRRMALLDLGIAVVLAYTRWDATKIRALAEGNPQGYRVGEDGAQPPIPPIVVIGWVDGSLPPEDKAPAYTRGAKLNRTWLLRPDRVYSRRVRSTHMFDAPRPGLHATMPQDAYSSGTIELEKDRFDEIVPGRRPRRPKPIPWEEVLAPLPPDWLPSTTVDTAPHEQAVRFEMRSDVVAAMCTARSLDTPWDEVAMEDLDLQATLVVPEDPPRTIDIPLHESKSPSRPKRSRRFELRLHRAGHVKSGSDHVPWPFKVKASLELPRLLTRYEVVVASRKGGTEWVRQTVDFRSPRARRAVKQRPGDDPGWWAWLMGEEAKEAQVTWHTVKIRAPPTADFATARIGMTIPYRYRILGSTIHHGDEQPGAPFREDGDRLFRLDAKGGLQTFSRKDRGVEQVYTLEFAEEGTLIQAFTFLQRTEAEGDTSPFALGEVPLLFSRRLPGTTYEMRLFGVKGPDLVQCVTRTPPPVVRDALETHPETREKVPVRLTYEVTRFGVPPEDGSACIFMVTVESLPPEKVQELVTSGRVSVKVLENFLHEFQMEALKWVNDRSRD